MTDDYSIVSPSYPTQRAQVPEGWRLEVMPLWGARGRITITDGCSVTEFW